MVSFVKGGSKLMKRDLSILSEYVRISTPDKDRLAELVVRAKGPELSMSQFAKKCEVNPSTLSRIVNKKTTGKNSDALIFNIAENADPNSGVTFEMLMSAHGMKKRNLNGKVDTEEYRAFEKNAADLVLSEIMKRGYKVQVPMTPQVYNALNYHYRPDWEIATDAVTSDNTMGQWLFEFWTMLGTEQQAIRKQTIKLRQKLLMVLGLYYMDEVKADKLSFVVFNRKFYKLLKDTLEGICVKPWITIMLFDMEQAQFIEEFTFLSPDGSVRDSNMKISMNEECDDYTDDLFEDINGRNQFMD
jgi:transcriptional regulator with XRE-family HTH domain